MASHWVVKIVMMVVKIVVMIALAIVFGVLGIAIGLPAFIFSHKILGMGHGEDGAGVLLGGSMLVFGILGAVLGGYVGHWLIPNKDK